MFDIFQLRFKKVHLKTLNKLNQSYISTNKLSKKNIFHQSLYHRLIMKNSFKISKGILHPNWKITSCNLVCY